jgi:alpha-N-acetylglucosamine transferase
MLLNIHISDIFLFLVVAVGLILILAQWRQVDFQRGYERGQYEFYSLLNRDKKCPKDDYVLVKTIHNEVYVAEWRSEDGHWYCNRGIMIADKVEKWKPICKMAHA